MTKHLAVLERVLGYANLMQEERESILAAIALMRGQSEPVGGKEDERANR